ncbi:MAG: HEAT repeat domain-containing protein [Planctomycetota bacterium]|jgi:hypothetical protein
MLDRTSRLLDIVIAVSILALGAAVFFESQEIRLVVVVLCVFCAVLWLHSRRLERQLAHFDDMLTDVRFGEGTKRDRDAVDILVRAMETPDPNVRETALKTLRKITEQDFGHDADQWQKWWIVARPTFKRPTPLKKKK